MRFLVALAFLLSLVGAASARERVEWILSGRQISYGVRESGVVVFSANCESGPGYDVVFGMPGDYPGPYRNGQSAQIALSSGGRPVATLTGSLLDSEGESLWLFHAKTGDDHPLFVELFNGRSVKVSTRTGSYDVSPRSGRVALASFRDACKPGR